MSPACWPEEREQRAPGETSRTGGRAGGKRRAAGQTVREGGGHGTLTTDGTALAWQCVVKGMCTTSLKKKNNNPKKETANTTTEHKAPGRELHCFQ